MTNPTEQAADVLERLDGSGRALMFTQARTANTFSSIPVSDAELLGIWELAKWGPTSSNTQPLRVLYVHSGEGRERLVHHMFEGNKAKLAGAPAVAVLAWDTNYHDHIPTLLPHRPEMRDVYEADEGMRTEAGRFNAILQAAYFIMSVRIRRRGTERRLLSRRPLARRVGGQHRPSRREPLVRPAPAPAPRRGRSLGLTAANRRLPHTPPAGPACAATVPPAQAGPPGPAAVPAFPRAGPAAGTARLGVLVLSGSARLGRRSRGSPPPPTVRRHTGREPFAARR